MFGPSNQPLSVFFSVPYTQQFLYHCYEKKQHPAARKKSYENCPRFISYIEHGQLYLQDAEKGSIQTKPLLQFYGIVQLLKACILIVDPDYPSNSIVLAHGVSTRKRKKNGYQFIHDEIRIQKNGLFPHAAKTMFSTMFDANKKFSMNELLTDIPETASLIEFYTNNKSTILAPTNLNELLTNYLLLYNLSMICRYETEWWSELLKQMPHFDYVLIQEFLSISPKKTIDHIHYWINNDILFIN